MDLLIEGIKCDHCDYEDTGVKFEDYHLWIDSKCPKCGSNLLTRHEYDSCVKLYKTVKAINKLLSIFKWINPFYYFNLFLGRKKTNQEITVVSLKLPRNE